MPVLFPPPVVRIVALPALAARMQTPGGPTVRIAPELRNETVFVLLREETPERLRGLIARVSRAEWVRDGSSLRLERSNALRRALAEEERQEALRATKNAREEIAREVLALPEDVEAAAKTERQVATAYNETLRAAGAPSTWTDATRRRLNAAYGPLYAAHRAAAPAERLASRLIAGMDPVALSLVPAGRMARFSSAPGRFVAPLGFDAGPMLARYGDEARTARESGMVSGESFTPKIVPGARIGLRMEELGGAVFVQGFWWKAGGEPTSFFGRNVEVEPAEDGRWPGSERWSTLPKTEVWPMRRTLDPALDPLESIAGDGVRAAAEASGEEIVLLLPDSAAESLVDATAQVAAEGLRRHLRFSEEGGMVLGSPRRPLRAVAERIPRALAPGFVRMLSGAATATILEVGAYAEGAGLGPPRTGLEHWLHNRSGTNLTAPSALGSYRGFLRAFAAMPGRAREAWLGGETFRLGELIPSARAAIESQVDEDAGRELRFAFPDGVPPEATLTAKVRREERLEVVGGVLNGKVTGAGTVAHALAVQRTGQGYGEELGSELVEQVLYRPLTGAVIEIVLVPGPGLESRAYLQENRATGEAPARWNALPAAYLDPIRKALEPPRRGGGGRRAARAMSRQRGPDVVRRRLVWGIAGLGSLLCGGVALETWSLFERFYDYRPAAAELPGAVKAYRETGLPWVAADLAPAPPVRAEENAAPLLRMAAKMATEGKWSGEDKALSEAAAAGEWAMVGAAIKRREETLALFERAARLPRADFGRDMDLGPYVLFPEFAGMKAGVKALGLRARLRASRGDVRGAEADLQTMRSLSRLAESDGVLISLLVRIACETITDDAAQRAAALEPRLAEGVRADLERPYPEPDFARSLRSEAFLAIATARNLQGAMTLHSSDEQNENEFAKTETDPSRLVRDGVPAGKVQQAYLARSLQVWIKAAAEMRRHGDDAVALSSAMDRLAEGEQKKRGLSFTMNKIVFPVFTQAGAAVAKLKTGRMLTLAYLQAVEDRRRTGSWPKALISGRDPYGRAFVSRREGAGFRIYSLGPNGKDDGGLASAERPVGEKSDDVVVVFPPPVRKQSGTPSRTSFQ